MSSWAEIRVGKKSKGEMGRMREVGPRGEG